MPRLTIKTYKRPDDDWVLVVSPYLEQNFTQEEIDGIIKPSEDELKSVVGHIPQLSENKIDGNVYTAIRHYETSEGIQQVMNIHAHSQLFKDRKDLLLERTKELGIIYRVEILVD